MAIGKARNDIFQAVRRDPRRVRFAAMRIVELGSSVCRHRGSPAGVVGIVNQPADLNAMGHAVVVHEPKLRYVTNL